jgi:hypothetical protein
VKIQNLLKFLRRLTASTRPALPTHRPTYAPLTAQSHFTSETQNQEEFFFYDSDEGAGDSTGEDDFFDDLENDASSETEANCPTDEDTAMSTSDAGDHDQSSQSEHDPINHYSQTSKSQLDSDDSE